MLRNHLHMPSAHHALHQDARTRASTPLRPRVRSSFRSAPSRRARSWQKSRVQTQERSKQEDPDSRPTIRFSPAHLLCLPDMALPRRTAANLWKPSTRHERCEYQAGWSPGRPTVDHHDGMRGCNDDRSGAPSHYSADSPSKTRSTC